MAAVAATPGELSGQALTEHELPLPVATIKEGVKSVGSLRELSDGRVLVAEASPTRLLVADFTKGGVTTVMKQGTEADEFRSVGPFWPWPGDSVAAFDAQKSRLMILGPTGSLARAMPLGAPRASAGNPSGAPGRGPQLPQLRALVGEEFAIGVSTSARQVPAATIPPRLPYAVMRVSLRTMRSDTIVQLLPAQAPRTATTSTNAGAFVVYVGTAPLQPVDAWAAFPDGTVAVVRAASYRIEWFSIDGSRTATEPVPFTPISVTADDRKRASDEFKRSAVAALQTNTLRTSILNMNYDEPESWPSTHPPFRGDLAAQVDLHERMWLATRCATDAQATCYDVIDRHGTRVERFKVPPKTLVVGFGKDVVYTLRDQNGHLQRHPLGALP